VKFALSDDQTLLRDATRDFLATESPLETSRHISETTGPGFSRDHWRKLAELGYLALLAPASAGGQGLGAIELAVVLQEMGRVCFPGPYLDVVLAAKALELAGGHDAAIAAIGRGESLVTLATADRVWATDGGGGASAGNGRVQGTKVFVPFGAAADRLLVTAGAGLWLVDGPFRTTPMTTLDEAQRFAAVTLDHPATRLGAASLLDRLADLAAVGAAAFALGLCEGAGTMGVQYALGRETFGKPIAQYQALQHRLADFVVRTESSRAVVYRAAWALDAGRPDAGLVAAAAKAYAVESANLIARETLQVHGGNGFTWEYAVHRFLKRAVTLDQQYGRGDEMLERALAAVESATPAA
jgi:alkylation response protein AidB-like acyl-CoA dehydrogenase